MRPLPDAQDVQVTGLFSSACKNFRSGVSKIRRLMREFSAGAELRHNFVRGKHTQNLCKKFSFEWNKFSVSSHREREPVR
jgi:hypothetical protein